MPSVGSRLFKETSNVIPETTASRYAILVACSMSVNLGQYVGACFLL